MPKDQQEKNLLPLPPMTTTIDQSLMSGFFEEGQWPDDEWWTIFASSELNALVNESMAHNPSLQSIEKRVEAATEKAQVVRARLYPWLSADADETWTYLSRNGLYRALNPTIPLNANLVDLTLNFTYEFDFWGKNRNLFRASLGLERAQAAEYAQARLMISTALAQTFFSLQVTMKKAKLAKELVAVRQKIFALESLLHQKALFSLLPQLASKETLLSAEQLVLEFEDRILLDRHLINALVGKGPDSPLPECQEDFSLPAQLVIPQTLSCDLLARRPDLIAQIWRVESLAHDVGAAKADFFPNINLNAFAGLESIAYALLFKGGSKTVGLQPAIHLPIFTAGAIRANLREKKATFDEAVYAYNELLLKSAQEVADRLVTVRTLIEQKEQQNEIVLKARKRLELTKLLVAKGLDNNLTLYKRQEELIQRELEDLSLLLNQLQAEVQLIKSLGGGYQSEYAVPLTSQEPSYE